MNLDKFNQIGMVIVLVLLLALMIPVIVLLWMTAAHVMGRCL